MTPTVQPCPAVEHARSMFPAFTERPDLLFFDNASTTQKPQPVLDCMVEYYLRNCSNVGRSATSLSRLNTRRVEDARRRVAEFLRSSPDQVAFTSGATESLNAVAMSWAITNLRDGDEVMVCPDDHKSAVLPWFNLKALLARFGVTIKIVPFRIHEVGDYDLKSIRAAVSPLTRVVALSHIHHVFGLEMEVREIRDIVGESAVITLDASQSVGHTAVSAADLPVDFISFSGHKCFAGSGVGVLWARQERIGEMRPFRAGGTGSSGAGTAAAKRDTAFDLSLIGETLAVEVERARLAALSGVGCLVQRYQQLAVGVERARLAGRSAETSKDVDISGSASGQAVLADMIEAGTLNIPAILSMVPAVDLIEEIGIENIEKHVWQLTEHLYEALKELPRIRFAPGPGVCGCRGGYGILSFQFEQIDTSDLVFLLDEHGIMVRGGDHCRATAEAQEFVRVSMHLYNTHEEIDRFIAVLQENVFS